MIDQLEEGQRRLWAHDESRHQQRIKPVPSGMARPSRREGSGLHGGTVAMGSVGSSAATGAGPSAAASGGGSSGSGGNVMGSGAAGSTSTAVTRAGRRILGQKLAKSADESEQRLITLHRRVQDLGLSNGTTGTGTGTGTTGTGTGTGTGASSKNGWMGSGVGGSVPIGMSSCGISGSGGCGGSGSAASATASRRKYKGATPAQGAQPSLFATHTEALLPTTPPRSQFSFEVRARHVALAQRLSPDPAVLLLTCIYMPRLCVALPERWLRARASTEVTHCDRRLKSR